jgi:predicted DNA binding CopG/RHH family protein
MRDEALKKIPRFENEDEERAFWADHDSAEYVNWRGANDVRLPKLKPTTRTISIRLPETMLDHLRILANKRDVPYQSLLKIYFAERIEEELRLNCEHPGAGKQ